MAIDDELFKQAKLVAAQKGETVAKVVEDALREAFARRAESSSRRVTLLTFGGEGDQAGTQPGVDIDDSAALLELLDPPHAHP